MAGKTKTSMAVPAPTVERAHHSGAWLEERLRQDILDGRVLVGNKLFSSERLADYYAVDKMTANRVVQRLARDGLLRVQRGSGTFLNKPRAAGSGGLLVYGYGKTAGGYAPVLREIRLCLQKCGYTCAVMGREEGGDVPGDNAYGPALGRVTARKFDVHIGLGIMNREYYERLCWLETPVLAVDFAPGLERVSSVSAASFNTGYSAAQWLLKNGHERFLFMPLFRGSLLRGTLHRELDSYLHECGWRHALQSAGKQTECHYLDSNAKEAPQREEAIRELFRGPDRPTAIFGNGYLDFEIEVLRKLGLKVPGDVSVVASVWGGDEASAGDLDITRYTVSWREMARETVRILEGLVQGEGGTVQRVMVNAHFHEGSTVRSLRGRLKA